MVKNVVIQISNYATHYLQDAIDEMNKDGYRLISTEMGKNKHGVIVMYLFFEKTV